MVFLKPKWDILYPFSLLFQTEHDIFLLRLYNPDLKSFSSIFFTLVNFSKTLFGSPFTTIVVVLTIDNSPSSLLERTI